MVFFHFLPYIHLWTQPLLFRTYSTNSMCIPLNGLYSLHKHTYSGHFHERATVCEQCMCLCLLHSSNAMAFCVSIFIELWMTYVNCLRMPTFGFPSLRCSVAEWAFRLISFNFRHCRASARSMWLIFSYSGTCHGSSIKRETMHWQLHHRSA